MSGRLSGGVFGRSHTSRSWKWESCGLIPRLSSYGMAIASATRSHSATSSSARCSRATIRSYRSAQAVRDMKESWPDRYERMVARLHLADEEVAEWERVADAMAIPYDESLGINPQDSHFHEREVWDLPNTPPDRRPLMLHYHPLVIYRFQVLKQADVVLATFLQGEQFTAEQKRADFEYYDPITTGDSTLSAVVQSIMAAEVGYHEMALHYFHAALFVDLADLHQNTVDGVHIASAAGVWGALVNGFGGMRAHDEELTFDPRLPQSWSELKLKIAFRGSRLRVTVRQFRLDLAIDS